MSMEALTPIRPIQSMEGGTAAPGAPSMGSGLPFADLLGQAMRDVADAQGAAAGDAADLVMGTGDDLHSIMIRSAMETTAIETAVELTTRVVAVYKEIMQMQV